MPRNILQDQLQGETLALFEELFKFTFVRSYNGIEPRTTTWTTLNADLTSPQASEPGAVFRRNIMKNSKSLGVASV
jgi:hypothetical protein